MSVLCWDKPKRAMSIKSWKGISADSAPPGVYTPNMSDADKLKWKAKYVGGDYPRVEIRKTVRSKKNYAQVLVIVWQKGVDMSQNGTASWSASEFDELQLAVAEARDRLSYVEMMKTR